MISCILCQVLMDTLFPNTVDTNTLTYTLTYTQTDIRHTEERDLKVIQTDL